MIRKLRRYQLVVDLAVAALFFLLLLTAAREVGVFILCGMTLALALRRLSPPLALGVAWLTVICQLSLGIGARPANVAILAVLYATAAYGKPIVKWLGLASAGAGALLATIFTVLIQNAVQIDSGQFSGNVAQITLVFAIGFVTSLGVLGLSWTLGLLAKTRASVRESRVAEAEALAEQQRARAQAATEQERNRIARDMHDVVAHSLAVVIAQADGARYAQRTDPGLVNDALSTISDTARQALGDVRVLLAQLRHAQTDAPQPGLGDLDQLLAQLRTTGMQITSTTTGDSGQLGTGGQLALYRIVQEALTNALRHGEPGSVVQLSQTWGPRGVRVRVVSALPADYAQTVLSAASGHGLAGMRERAALAGGTFTAAPGHNRMFVVDAYIPLQSETRTLPVVEEGRP